MHTILIELLAILRANFKITSGGIPTESMNGSSQILLNILGILYCGYEVL